MPQPEIHPDDGIAVVRRPNGRKRVMTINLSESVTDQAGVNDSEIKHIMAKYEQTGVLPRLSTGDLAYRDITTFDDYADAMRHAETAKQQFMSLDPRIRRVFSNNHLEWLDAGKDGLTEIQAAQLEKLGILERSETLPHDGSTADSTADTGPVAEEPPTAD